MNQKLLIYNGIAFLVTGILLKSFGILDPIGLNLILVGATLKTIFIIIKLGSGEYKPGFELASLLTGLFLFFFFKNSDFEYNYLLMGLGIALKVLFVILFIRKIRP